MSEIKLTPKYEVNVDSLAKLVYGIGLLISIFMFLSTDVLLEKALWFIGFFVLDAAAGIYLIGRWLGVYVNIVYLQLKKQEEE